MTIADELRKYADMALREDGIYFSGAYLDRLARRAMSEQAENAKLRELVTEMYPYAKAFLQQGVMLGCNDTMSYDWFLQLRKMGIEVSE